MAHYRFGQEVLNRFEPELKALIHNHRAEYEIGLQGPDIFYYYKPYSPNRYFNHGFDCHAKPAINMFAPMFEQTHEGAALSYLIGLVCHYALDRSCHPYVYANTKKVTDHFVIESAFDDHIIKTCGLTEERYKYIPSDADFAAMAALWPGIGERIVKKSVRAQRFCTRLIDRRRIVRAFETLVNKRDFLTKMSPRDPESARQERHIEALETLYQRGLGECPTLVKSAIGAMRANTPYCVGFHLNYEGIDPAECTATNRTAAETPAG